MKQSFLILAFAVLSGCVSLETVPGGVPGAFPGQPAAVLSYPDVDAGGVTVKTLHFTLRGYDDRQLQSVGSTFESLFNKIGSDMGIYSTLAASSYSITLYRDREEYLRKTNQPAWSRSISAGTSIYTYPDTDLESALAHELTHVIFNGVMGDKAANFRWLLEGLAMVEEIDRTLANDRADFQVKSRDNLRLNKMTFSYMTFFVPATEERRLTDNWYQQVESVTRYLLSQGSPLNFSGFLNDLKNGADLDRAVQNNYPARFRSLNDFESAWRGTL